MTSGKFSGGFLLQSWKKSNTSMFFYVFREASVFIVSNTFLIQTDLLCNPWCDDFGFDF